MPRLIVAIPYFLYIYFRGAIAKKRRDWEKVVSFLSRLEIRELITDDLRLELSCAYMQLGRWDEAIRASQRIRQPFSNIQMEAIRWVNESIALLNLGREEEAAQLMTEKLDERWPSAQKLKARSVIDAVDT